MQDALKWHTLSWINLCNYYCCYCWQSGTASSVMFVKKKSKIVTICCIAMTVQTSPRLRWWLIKTIMNYLWNAALFVSTSSMALLCTHVFRQWHLVACKSYCSVKIWPSFCQMWLFYFFFAVEEWNSHICPVTCCLQGNTSLPLSGPMEPGESQGEWRMATSHRKKYLCKLKWPQHCQRV